VFAAPAAARVNLGILGDANRFETLAGQTSIRPEWGLWGLDDPAFITKMAPFVRTHKRVELLAYFNSKPGSIFDLESKPRSRAAYGPLIVPLG
jgi:hypothetical protein